MRRVAMVCAAVAVLAGAGSATAASAATTDPITAQRLVSASLYLSSATAKARLVTVATASTGLSTIAAEVNSSLNQLAPINASSGLGLDPLLGLQGALSGTLGTIARLQLGLVSITSDSLGSVGSQLNSELNQLSSIDAAAGLGLDETLSSAGSLTGTTTTLLSCLLCTRTT